MVYLNFVTLTSISLSRRGNNMSKSLGTLFRNSKVLIQVKVGKNGNMGLCYKGVLFSKTVIESNGNGKRSKTS